MNCRCSPAGRYRNRVARSGQTGPLEAVASLLEGRGLPKIGGLVGGRYVRPGKPSSIESTASMKQIRCRRSTSALTGKQSGSEDEKPKVPQLSAKIDLNLNRSRRQGRTAKGNLNFVFRLSLKFYGLSSAAVERRNHRLDQRLGKSSVARPRRISVTEPDSIRQSRSKAVRLSPERPLSFDPGVFN
jgi:hypothetical protein